MNNPEIQKIIEWQNPKKDLYIGYQNGKWVCKISCHWTGYWLDGFGIPIVFGSLEKAKEHAQEILEGKS